MFARTRINSRLKNPSVAGTTIFPAKDFYFNDFAGIADATLLRSLPGWVAYNSAASTNVARDLWYVQGEIIQSTATEDYEPAPGRFILGRETGCETARRAERKPGSGQTCVSQRSVATVLP